MSLNPLRTNRTFSKTYILNNLKLYKKQVYFMMLLLKAKFRIEYILYFI